MKLARRNFFLVAAGALLRAAERVKRDMLVRSTRPEDLEMALSGFSDYITPIEHFFVRTHVYVPTVNANEWRLKVEGEVAAPLTLSMEDLKKLPTVELVSVVECAGNGRGFYEPSVPGLNGRMAAWATRAGAVCGWPTSSSEPVSKNPPKKFCSMARMSRSAPCPTSSDPSR